MTKEVLIESVYLKITGGKPSSQSSVRREDISSLLPAVIAAAWSNEMDKRMAQFLQMKRLGINKPLSNEDFKITQYLSPSFDGRKNAHYLDIPNGIPILNGISEWDISPVEGVFSIYKINKLSDLVGLEDSVNDLAYAYYINNPTPRLYIHNIDSCELQVTTALNIDNIGDTDLLPIPANKEFEVINALVEFFTGQRLFPDDKKVDQIDNAKQQMQR